jgi:hypothetical protein
LRGNQAALADQLQEFVAGFGHRHGFTLRMKDPIVLPG